MAHMPDWETYEEVEGGITAKTSRFCRHVRSEVTARFAIVRADKRAGGTLMPCGTTREARKILLCPPDRTLLNPLGLVLR